MAELIEYFVDEMPARVASLEQFWKEQRLEDLRVLAHQLRGASGGYGFGPLGDAACSLEKTIQQLGQGASSASLDGLREQFDQLVGMCKRVSK